MEVIISLDSPVFFLSSRPSFRIMKVDSLGRQAPDKMEIEKAKIKISYRQLVVDDSNLKNGLIQL